MSSGGPPAQQPTNQPETERAKLKKLAKRTQKMTTWAELSSGLTKPEKLALGKELVRAEGEDKQPTMKVPVHPDSVGVVLLARLALDNSCRLANCPGDADPRHRRHIKEHGLFTVTRPIPVGVRAPAVRPDFLAASSEVVWPSESQASFTSMVRAMKAQKDALTHVAYLYDGPLAELAAGLPDKNGFSVNLLDPAKTAVGLPAVNGPCGSASAEGAKQPRLATVNELSVYARVPFGAVVETESSGNKGITCWPGTLILTRLFMLALTPDVRNYKREENDPDGRMRVVVDEVELLIEEMNSLPKDQEFKRMMDELKTADASETCMPAAVRQLYTRGFELKTPRDAIAMLLWLCAKFVNYSGTSRELVDQSERKEFCLKGADRYARGTSLCGAGLELGPRAIVSAHLKLELYYAQRTSGETALAMVTAQEALDDFCTAIQHDWTAEYGIRFESAATFARDHASFHNGMADSVTEETGDEVVRQILSNVLLILSHNLRILNEREEQLAAETQRHNNGQLPVVESQARGLPPVSAAFDGVRPGAGADNGRPAEQKEAVDADRAQRASAAAASARAQDHAEFRASRVYTAALPALKAVFHGLKSIGRMFSQWHRGPAAYFVAIYAYYAAEAALVKVPHRSQQGAVAGVDGFFDERLQWRVGKRLSLLWKRCDDSVVASWHEKGLFELVPGVANLASVSYSSVREWLSGDGTPVAERVRALELLCGHLVPRGAVEQREERCGACRADLARGAVSPNRQCHQSDESPLPVADHTLDGVLKDAHDVMQDDNMYIEFVDPSAAVDPGNWLQDMSQDTRCTPTDPTSIYLK